MEKCEECESLKTVWVVYLYQDSEGGEIRAIVKGNKEKAEHWAMDNIVKGDMRWLYKDGCWRKGYMYIDLEEYDVF